jgi:hypothetical protein
MSNQKPKIGSIGWIDLTVPDADGLRDFYQDVIGWDTTPVDMGGYADHCMDVRETGESVAGICNRRGTNASMPGGWMIYIIVADVEASAARCRERGGEILVEPKTSGMGTIAVMRDPSGAVAALYAPAS